MPLDFVKPLLMSCRDILKALYRIVERFENPSDLVKAFLGSGFRVTLHVGEQLNRLGEPFDSLVDIHG
jgi:hypothetical protein